MPFGRLNNVTDLVVHPQLTERGRIRPVELPDGQTTGFLPPFNIEGLEPRMGAVPKLGQHTREVLAGLGFGEADLARLRSERIIGTA